MGIHNLSPFILIDNKNRKIYIFYSKHSNIGKFNHDIFCKFKSFKDKDFKSMKVTDSVDFSEINPFGDVDSSGNIHLISFNIKKSINSKIIYSFFNYKTKKWTSSTIPFTDDAAIASIKCDSHNNPHIIFFKFIDNLTQGYYYIYKKDGHWSKPMKIHVPSYIFVPPKIAIDSNDRIWIAFIDSKRRLVVKSKLLYENQWKDHTLNLPDSATIGLDIKISPLDNKPQIVFDRANYKGFTIFWTKMK